MAIATDQQVQTYCDTRLRVRAEQARAFFVSLADDINEISDVFAACAQQNPTFVDSRLDGPPRLLTPQDVLVYNTIGVLLAKVIAGTATTQDITDIHANWNTFQTACVRPI